MNHEYNSVVEFNQKVLGISPRRRQLQPLEEAKLSHTQMMEEVNEFLEAVETGDYIGAIDACIDNLVFTMGVLYKMGIDKGMYSDIFEVVMAANMSKKIGVKTGREGFDAVDAVKPDNWIPPEEVIACIIKDADQ